MVAVVPCEPAPGTVGVTVPPPDTPSPDTVFVYWNDLVVGTAVSVHVPL